VLGCICQINIKPTAYKGKPVESQGRKA